MKFYLTFCLLFIGATNIFCQDIYDAEFIPSALKNRANAVIRNEEDVIAMYANDNVSYVVKKAITVLNKNGENNARLVLNYNKNTSIKSIKGELYNEVGKLVGKFNQNDFKDESAVSDFSMFEDDRVKHYLPAATSYPYTVVYNYEIRFKQNLIIPEWTPQPSNDVAIEKSTFKFIYNPINQIQIKNYNLNLQPEESNTDKLKTLTWKVENINAFKTEVYAPNQNELEKRIKITANNFSYFNYKGTFTDWNTLGKWSFDALIKDRQTLPPVTVALIQDLVKSEKTDKDKAKKIYEYLQQKTRYISVQIGIGGFQPFKAEDVDRLGYGDCKALVNYMQSMLKAVNVESYYCIVNAGNNKTSLDPNFASMDQANHVILCLPLKGDTTWLECTSQDTPFGYLGTFTDDRYVLACTREGGKLLKTPKYTAQNSTQIRSAELVFDENGNVSGAVNTTFLGSQYDNHEELFHKTPLEQEQLLKAIYDIDNINFNKINLDQVKSENPITLENLKIDIRNYGSINNDKLFFYPNAFNTKNSIAETSIRKFPIEVTRGYADIDTIRYTLPKNVLPVSSPIEKNVETKFGSYYLSTKMENGKLIYIRKFSMKDGEYPATDFNDFAGFINQASQNDRLKLVFSLTK